MRTASRTHRSSRNPAPSTLPAGADAAASATSLATRPVLSIADQIYESLRNGILTGALTPGSRIIELDVARAMGTSQGPVREALQRLALEGLVDRQARTSTVVTSVTAEEMLELFETRSLIETFAARRLAPGITAEQLDASARALERMKDAAARDDPLDMTKWDRAFHRALCVWADRTTLLRAWEPLFTQIQRFIVQNHRSYDASVLEIARGHEGILEALRARDAERAANAVRSHIMDAWTRMGSSTSPPEDS